MDVRVCKRCKKIFQHISGPQVCPKCKEKEEELFQVVKEYLRKNPGAAMHVVSEETEVPVSLIESFLRQGRLEVSPGSAISLTCENCNVAIYTGRLCSKCNASLIGELSGASKQMTANKLTEDLEKKKTEKMRFLQSDKIK